MELPHGPLWIQESLVVFNLHIAHLAPLRGTLENQELSLIFEPQKFPV